MVYDQLLFIKIFRRISDWLQSPGLFLITSRRLPYLEDVNIIPNELQLK